MKKNITKSPPNVPSKLEKYKKLHIKISVIFSILLLMSRLGFLPIKKSINSENIRIYTFWLKYFGKN
jgi:hypothetical protein